ncbi:MAG TPA: DUF1684 domain-containing protein [Thermoanaerobaculia bacterium]|nr:DUF1684 domain-containing protein [Thermoanaerobaculia bacterium]
MKRFAALALVIVTACGTPEPKVDPVHQQEIQAWQKDRDTRLRKEDSWLTLIGLHWLKDGENEVTLSKPNVPHVRVLRNGATTTLHPDPAMTIGGKPVTADVPLLADADANGPTIVQMGPVRFNVIKRGERYALRVKDAEAETRTQFQGLQYYPIDPKWRVTARFEAYHPPKMIPITDVTGATSDSLSPGALLFELDGKEFRLDPILEEGSDEYFIIFRDLTSSDTTYQAGRYLYAPMAKDGKTTIDFNKAYNPPCAFTHFATCPLPPMQNRMPIRVEAGEKRYAGHH